MHIIIIILVIQGCTGSVTEANVARAITVSTPVAQRTCFRILAQGLAEAVAAAVRQLAQAVREVPELVVPGKALPIGEPAASRRKLAP